MERTASERRLLAESASYDQELSLQPTTTAQSNGAATATTTSGPPPHPPPANIPPQPTAPVPAVPGDVQARLRSISSVIAQQQQQQQQQQQTPMQQQAQAAIGYTSTIDQLLGPRTSLGVLHEDPGTDYLNLPPYHMPQDAPPRPRGRGFAARMNKKGSFRKLVEKVMSGDDEPPPPRQQQDWPRRRPKPEINDLRDKSGCKAALNAKIAFR